MAEAALRIHQRTIDSKRIRLVRRFSEDASAQVHPSEVLQVLSNLIVNALEALPSWGTLHVRVKQTREHVVFLIADDGHGIAPEHKEQLFQLFFSTKQSGGNGLGLALSKKIVEGHGGSIRLRSSSRAGKSGTVFRISLPSNAGEAQRSG